MRAVKLSVYVTVGPHLQIEMGLDRGSTSVQGIRQMTALVLSPGAQGLEPRIVRGIIERLQQQVSLAAQRASLILSKASSPFAASMWNTRMRAAVQCTCIVCVTTGHLSCRTDLPSKSYSQQSDLFGLLQDIDAAHAEPSPAVSKKKVALLYVLDSVLKVTHLSASARPATKA